MTAERVRRAVEALQFYPDTNARSLGSGRSSLYGLIISDITNPFFPELVKSFEDISVEHGQEVLVANTNYDPARMESCVTRMMQRKVDGVAIMTSEMEDRLVKVFSHRNIPLVFMDVGEIGPGVSRIRVDHAAGVAMAMDHLVGLGHRKIAFISGPLDLFSARTRFEAFLQSLDRHGLQRDAAQRQPARAGRCRAGPCPESRRIARTNATHAVVVENGHGRHAADGCRAASAARRRSEPSP